MTLFLELHQGRSQICLLFQQLVWSICNISKIVFLFPNEIIHHKLRKRESYYHVKPHKLLFCAIFLRYEELLSSHESLLKLLESRAEEVQNCHKDNDKLRDDIQKLSIQLSEYEQSVHKLCEKYLALKKRKDMKVCFLMATRRCKIITGICTIDQTKYKSMQLPNMS